MLTKERLYELIRFSVVGGTSFVVDYALLYICTEWLGMYYLWSSAIAFTVSVLVNYWLCVVYVFTGAGKQNSKQAALFIGSSIVGLGINQVCMWTFVDLISMHYMLAKIFATFIVMFWNYVMKRKAVQGFDSDKKTAPGQTEQSAEDAAASPSISSQEADSRK